MAVDIRRGTDRFAERRVGRLTRHAFSFGEWYDAEHVRFGPMVCHDEHLVREGEGFPEHDHADLTIITWVVSGAVSHSGPEGSATLRPGQCGIFHTGPGTVHAEVAAAPQTRFVQVWLSTVAAGSSYTVVTPDLVTGHLVEVGEPIAGAVLSVVRLEDHQSVVVPAAPRVHVFVARGALLRSSLAEPLHEGDAFLFTEEPAHELTAGVPTELLVWAFT